MLALPPPPKLLALPAPPMVAGDQVIWATAQHHYYQRSRNKDNGRVGRVLKVNYWTDYGPTVRVHFSGREDICRVSELRLVKVV